MSRLEYSQAEKGPSPRFRVRFEKKGPLKYISHHDLMRVFELALRRAGIPVAHTRGFNPRPKLSFALALPLGVESLDELVDIDVEHGACDAAKLKEKLAAQLPQGLSLLDAWPAQGRPRVCGCEYRCELLLNEGELAALRGRLADFLKQTGVAHTRSRGAGKPPRRLDIRAFTEEASLEGHVLRMKLRMTNQGGAKPGDLLEVLGLDPRTHAITKTRTLLEE